MSGEHARASRWGPRSLIIASVTLSWGVTIATLYIAQKLPGPWKFRFIQADTVSIGGGPGQGSIILSAELDGMVMATFKGAASADSLTLTVSPKGNPAITIESASGKPALVLEHPPSGQPRIRLMDAASGKKGWSVTLDANGQPVIEP